MGRWGSTLAESDGWDRSHAPEDGCFCRDPERWGLPFIKLQATELTHCLYRSHILGFQGLKWRGLVIPGAWEAKAGGSQIQSAFKKNKFS